LNWTEEKDAFWAGIDEHKGKADRREVIGEELPKETLVIGIGDRRFPGCLREYTVVFRLRCSKEK